MVKKMSESKVQLKNTILILRKKIKVYENILEKEIQDILFLNNRNSNDKLEELKDYFLELNEIISARLN